MDKLFFQDAGVKHFVRKKRIRGMLDGKISISEVKQLSHKECELGIWLYSEGLKKFGKVEEMRELEAIHLQLHNSCNTIINLMGQNNKKAAEEEFKKMEDMTKTMVRVLILLSIQVESYRKSEK